MILQRGVTLLLEEETWWWQSDEIIALTDNRRFNARLYGSGFSPGVM